MVETQLRKRRLSKSRGAGLFTDEQLKELRRAPLFAIGEVAKFFGRSVDWMRWVEDERGGFSLGGHWFLVPRRMPDGRIVATTAGNGYRVYSLDVIESIVCTVWQQGRIEAGHAEGVLLIVEGLARVHGYL